MLFRALGVLMLAAVAALLMLAVRWLWRKRGVARWVGVPIPALLAVLFTLFTIAAVRGIVRAHRSRGRPARELTVAKDSARVVRGQHIARVTCAGCHSTTYDIPLTGGKNLSEEAHMPLGDIVPFNLTPGGPLKDWTDGQIFRAIREGADKDNKPLVVMTSQGVRLLGDEDLEAVVAFLRSQLPVVAETRPERLTTLTYMMAGLNMLPLIDTLPPEKIPTPARAATAEYGKYVVDWVGCRECHGQNLTGGDIPVGPPPGPTLRTVQGWTEEGFIKTLRTGVTPFGKQLNSEMMPWKTVGRLDDDELSAVYAYLKSLPPVAATK